MVLYKKGLTLFEMKKYDSAMESFSKVLELDPENKEAFYQRGLALFELETIIKSDRLSRLRQWPTLSDRFKG